MLIAWLYFIYIRTISIKQHHASITFETFFILKIKKNKIKIYIFALNTIFWTRETFFIFLKMTFRTLLYTPFFMIDSALFTYQTAMFVTRFTIVRTGLTNFIFSKKSMIASLSTPLSLQKKRVLTNLASHLITSLTMFRTR